MKKNNNRPHIINALLNTDLTYTEIGEEFNLSKQRIDQIAKENGIRKHEIKRIKKKEQCQELDELLQQNLPIDLIRAHVEKNYGKNFLNYWWGQKHHRQQLEKIYIKKRRKMVMDAYKNTNMTPYQIMNSDKYQELGLKKVEEQTLFKTIYGKTTYRKKTNKDVDRIRKTIYRLRQKKKTFVYIAKYLNDGDYTSQYQKPFTKHNVCGIYHCYVKNKKKG